MPIASTLPTIWVTGLPASGKRTLATAIADHLRVQGQAAEVIDSGRLRRTPLGATLGFSRDDRDTNMRRHAMAAAMLTRNGVLAVVSAVSPYRATRETIRAELGEFIEVWVSTPPDICGARDQTGNWARALAGEIKGFTGVDAPYEAPAAPEFQVDLTQESVDAAALRVVTFLETRGAPSTEIDQESEDLTADLGELGYSD
jgi:adenylylsulfate kinase